MNKTCASCVALAAMATLLVAGCGLKDDLYIATENAEVATADDKSTDNESTAKEPDPSSAPAP